MMDASWFLIFIVRHHWPGERRRWPAVTWPEMVLTLLRRRTYNERWHWYWAYTALRMAVVAARLTMSSLSGSFLIARPVLRDPSFAGTVVLILQHSEEGALGLVMNRPVEAEGIQLPVFVGGPCKAPGLFLLHGPEEWCDVEHESVTPGIFLGNQDCMGRAADAPVEQSERLRAYAGYAGWGPGQLESELAEGAWAVTRASGEVLFHTPVEDLWDRLAPPSIPQPSQN